MELRTIIEIGQTALGGGIPLKRQDSFPVSTVSQWWVRRSSSAVVILASPNTDSHSPKAGFVVTIVGVRS